MAAELTVTGYHGCSNMLREFSLRAAAIFFAAAAAVLTLSACGDKATDSKETLPAATVATATQSDNDSKANNAQSSTAVNAGETSRGSYQSSSGGHSGKSSAGASSSNSDKTSGSSSPEVPAATVVIDSGDREIVIEQGENELPFIPN